MNYNSIRLIFNKARRMKRHVNLEGAGAWGMPSQLRECMCKGPVAGSLACLRKQRKPCGRSSQGKGRRGEEAGGSDCQGLEGYGTVPGSHGSRARRVRLSHTLRLSCPSPLPDLSHLLGKTLV